MDLSFKLMALRIYIILFFISLKIENIYNFALVLEFKFQSKSTTSNALPSSKTTAATSAKSIELLCHTTIKSNFA